MAGSFWVEVGGGNAAHPEKWKELGGVREVTMMKKGRDQASI
jgi:hypothetical protein